jgi:WD40 repeat protein
VANGIERLRLPTPNGRAAVFTPDGKFVLAPDKDGKINLFDAGSGKRARVLEVPLEPQPGWDTVVSSLAVNPAGSLLAIGGTHGTACLLELESGKELRRFEAPGSECQSVAFAPDGKTLATAGLLDSTPRLWDVETGRKIYPQSGHHSVVASVAFHADGRSLISYGGDRQVLAWDLATGKARQVFRAPRYSGLTLAPGGRLLA